MSECSLGSCCNGAPYGMLGDSAVVPLATGKRLTGLNVLVGVSDPAGGWAHEPAAFGSAEVDVCDCSRLSRATFSLISAIRFASLRRKSYDTRPLSYASTTV